MRRIDPSSDPGGRFRALADGRRRRNAGGCQPRQYRLWGGHESDPETMFNTPTAAKANGVIIGAHPGCNDREGFDRRVIAMHPDEIGRLVVAQARSHACDEVLANLAAPRLTLDQRLLKANLISGTVVD